MGWGEIREQVRERQQGKCAVCGEALPRQFVCHHILNKHLGGGYSLSNAEGRHLECENYMHRTYKNGNLHDPPKDEWAGLKRGEKKQQGKLRRKQQPVRVIEWHYFEDIRFYYRKKVKYGSVGRRLRTPQREEERPRIAPSVLRTSNEVIPLHHKKKRSTDPFRVGGSQRGRSHRRVQRLLRR